VDAELEMENSFDDPKAAAEHHAFMVNQANQMMDEVDRLNLIVHQLQRELNKHA
jgi:hypothetical protein